MKKTIQIFAIAFTCAAFSQSLFAAENWAAANTQQDNTAATASSNANNNTNATTTSNTAVKSKSASSIIQELQKSGLIVKSLSFDKDNNKFSVEAVDRRGDKQSLDVNSITGLTPDQKKQPHEVSLAQVVKKVEKNGAYVKSVDTSADSYTITAVDKTGTEQKYTVDLKTGNLTKS